jgi:hypothetical protein
MSQRMTEDEIREVIRERMSARTQAMCEDLAIPFVVAGGALGEPFVVTIHGASDEAVIGVLEAAALAMKNRPKGDRGQNDDGPAVV